MTNQEQNVDEAQIGRILHVVIESRGGRLACRPAIVVEDWGKPGEVNVQVFTDGSNDGAYGTDNHQHTQVLTTLPPASLAKTMPANTILPTHWEPSVNPNHDVKAKTTWHWPRECRHLKEPAPFFTDAQGQRWFHVHAVGIAGDFCYACQRQLAEQPA